jgi:hypothetical protein
VKPGCYGIITSPGQAFIPVSALVAAGYRANQITVLAYNSGAYLGSASYNLTTTPRVLNFPASWGAVTEMQIQTDDAGDLVFFDLSLYPIIIDPPGKNSARRNRHVCDSPSHSFTAWSTTRIGLLSFSDWLPNRHPTCQAPCENSIPARQSRHHISARPDTAASRTCGR